MNEEISKLASAFGIRPVTLAAAPLIAEALDRIWEDPDLGPSVAKFTAITYGEAGFDLRVSISHLDSVRELVFEHFIAVFSPSSWGYGSQTSGPEHRRVAMDFRIPESLTRT